MSMKSQLRRKLEPDAVARAGRIGGVPEFIRKLASHAAAKIRKQYGVPDDAWRLPKNARL